MAKKGTSVWADYDENYRWCLRCRKEKGHFTIDELIELAKDWEQDFYAIIIKAIDEDMEQYFDVDDDGDYLTLYRATDFLEGK